MANQRRCIIITLTIASDKAGAFIDKELIEENLINAYALPLRSIKAKLKELIRKQKN